MPVIFGRPLRDTKLDKEKSRSVLQFLYEVHQQFDLERNSTETLLHPRDELTCFKLVLREHEAVFDEDPFTMWPRLCRKRVYRENMDCSELDTLANEVEDQLNAFNLVDRTSLVRRVLVEFQNNVELKQTLFNADYLVCSRLLDWFELLTLELLVVYRMSRIRFSFSDSHENPFFYFRQCTSDFLPHYKKCPITDVLLSYLGLAVNIKDPIRLLRLINRPKRGLDHSTFNALRQLAKETNLSATQVAMSFINRCQLGASHTSQTSDADILRPWRSGLNHLVDCLAKCQDALCGALDETVLVHTSSENRMSLDDAFLAVNQCIQAAGRALQKPLIGALKCPNDEDYDVVFTKAKIQEAADALCNKLRRLVSSDTMALPCGDTPGRPLLHGGSLLGRAAFRLARLLLVFCDECADDFGDSNTEGESVERGVLCSSTDMFTPTGRPPVASQTPTTTGRSDHLFRMLISPQTPLQSNSKVGGGHTEEVENDPPITTQRSLSELDEALTMPERPVFSRYQTDLDWSDVPQSPLYKRPTLSIRSALSEWNDLECHSMPAWTDSHQLTENANLTECSSALSFNLMKSSTSKVRPRKTPRALFIGPLKECNSLAQKCSSRVSRMAALTSKAGRCKKNPIVDSKQRCLTDFFPV
ncbi:hypothetical protein EG68_10234 [Paragonimus skrjabini miyazakii]|uniref:PCNA-interacting partner n=1 Tax=Paragonimus skrjabini miyazakii TaxID=59628 RepID=A0A8S9YL14_9TREM|nr:hypothetical protein EG68_10234 [Paragonimus skrjabini miyazakii]